MAKKDREMIAASTLNDVKETGPATPRRRERPKSTTNITYIVTRSTHKTMRQYALDNETNLQQMLDDLVEKMFEDKGLGKFERATGGDK